MTPDDDAAVHRGDDGALAADAAETPEGPSVIRSEEELRIAMQQVETGRARLVKRVETETVTRTIELRREVLEVQQLADGDVSSETRTADAPVPPPMTIEEGPFSAGSFEEGVLDIVLMQEEATLSIENVPRERVRLTKTRQVEERAVDADLDVERVELETRSPSEP